MKRKPEAISDLSLDWHAPINVLVIRGWGYFAKVFEHRNRDTEWKWEAGYGHALGAGFGKTQEEAKEHAERWLAVEHERRHST